MSFFISPAMAEAAGAPPAPGMESTFLMLLMFVVIFYFMLWRPQSKRNKEHKLLISELSKGDEVVTQGGLLGKVTKVTEDFVSIEIADNTEIKVQKVAVTASLPKGTIKSI